MCDCVVLAVDHETTMSQVMNNWNREIFLVVDCERQNLRNISISSRMRVCVLIHESLVVPLALLSKHVAPGVLGIVTSRVLLTKHRC